MNKKLINPILNSLKKNFIVDSYPIIWNIQKSLGSRIVDSNNNSYLDFHGGFGSNPIGWNHPKLKKRFEKYDMSLFVNKPANSDFYTKDLVNFADNFKNKVVPKNCPYVFYIDGGALAVENALKVAMDWKCQKLGVSKDDLKILHLKKAFHGRTGYTLSLTNTDNHKIKNFSKFDWPRFEPPVIVDDKWDLDLDNKKLKEISKYMQKNKDNIAGMIMEPIQCEGGDRYFSRYFLIEIEKLCKTNDILFILDEVQTGFYTTGKPWCFQNYDLDPDIVSFGKKSQQCGIFAGKRLDEVKEHCFNTSGRINSTWGGNLIDMVRSNEIIDIINEDKLDVNAKDRGNQWNDKLRSIKSPHISNIRNNGLIMGFDCESGEMRDKLMKILKEDKLLLPPCGEPKTVRLRPNLAVTEEDIDECVKMIKSGLSKL